MRWLVVAALAFVGCDNDKVDNSINCVPPPFDAQDPYTVFSVAPGDTPMDTSGLADFSVSVASDGTSWTLTWTDPSIGDVCFTGLITITGVFGGTPGKVSGLEQVLYNESNQIAFASVPGANTDGVTFSSMTKPVSVEGFVQGSTNTDIYYSSSASRLTTDTMANVGSFTTP